MYAACGLLCGGLPILLLQLWQQSLLAERAGSLHRLLKVLKGVCFVVRHTQLVAVAAGQLAVLALHAAGCAVPQGYRSAELSRVALCRLLDPIAFCCMQAGD